MMTITTFGLGVAVTLEAVQNPFTPSESKNFFDVYRLFFELLCLSFDLFRFLSV